MTVRRVWPPGCEDVSPAAEERPLLEAATKQRSEDSDWEHLVCVWQCFVECSHEL
jgi:hypothetical protein